MRVFYLDTGLRSDVGHHANYCRYIVSELRRRNIETYVFAHREITSALRCGFQAVPHFHVDTYAPYGPWVGWRG